MTGHSGDKSANVGRSHNNATLLWQLVEMQLGMLVDSNCDDPQAHCAAHGDAVGDVGRPSRREGAVASSWSARAHFDPSRHQHAST